MNELNYVGRLTSDPTIKQGASGTTYGFVNIAQRQSEEKTNFIDFKIIGKTAEFIGKYFKKGDFIAINGHVESCNFTNENGQKVYKQELIIDRAYFCGYNASGARQQTDFAPAPSDAVTIAQEIFMPPQEALPF